MSSQGTDQFGGVHLTDAERSQLVDRIFSSASFQRSPRLKELLLYLYQSAAKGNGHAVSEHQIGIEVFDRAPDYDCSVDTIARVQVSQLRKKLQIYFATEGAAEPVIVDFPKGFYTPVFRARVPVAESGPPPSPIESQVRSPSVMVLGVALVLVSLLCVWLVWRTVDPRNAKSPARASSPALDQLWQGVFPAGQPVQFVMSDANLMVISDMMNGRTVSLFEYRSLNYPSELFNTYIADPKLRAQADHISGTHLTPFQDADVLRNVQPLSARYDFPLEVVYARDFRMQTANGNVILLGHKRGNPWVEMFEPRLNFRYEYVPDGSAFKALLRNQAPQPGEQEIYPVAYGQHGYSLIAYLPRPVGDGAALLISGTDMSSIEAGGHFLVDEKAVAELLNRLKVRKGAKIPYFELLLRTRLLLNVSSGAEIVAWRTPKL
jgi:hypothetical protein